MNGPKRPVVDFCERVGTSLEERIFLSTPDNVEREHEKLPTFIALCISCSLSSCDIDRGFMPPAALTLSRKSLFPATCTHIGRGETPRPQKGKQARAEERKGGVGKSVNRGCEAIFRGLRKLLWGSFGKTFWAFTVPRSLKKLGTRDSRYVQLVIQPINPRFSRDMASSLGNIFRQLPLMIRIFSALMLTSFSHAFLSRAWVASCGVP